VEHSFCLIDAVCTVVDILNRKCILIIRSRDFVGHMTIRFIYDFLWVLYRNQNSISKWFWDVNVLGSVCLHPAFAGTHWVRLSWSGWLATYRDGLLARKRSPIQVLTGIDVE